MRYDALGAVSRLSASRYGTFTRSEATAHGLSRARVADLIRAGVLREAPPGVLRAIAVRPSWEQDLAAAQAAGGGHGTVSLRSAARLLRLDGFADDPALDLCSTRRLKVPGASAHVVRELPTTDIVQIGPFRATGLARTLCDLGSVVSTDRLERALDSARRMDVNLRWVRETADRLHRPGQSGTGALLEQLAAIDPTQQVRGSWFERIIELMLKDPRIPAMARQFEVIDAHGRFVARPDLAIPLLRFAIEGHSREFHFGRSAERRDEDRDHHLAVIGWDVMYLGYQSTRRPASTLELVAKAVAVRSMLLGIEVGPERAR